MYIIYIYIYNYISYVFQTGNSIQTDDASFDLSPSIRLPGRRRWWRDPPETTPDAGGYKPSSATTQSIYIYMHMYIYIHIYIYITVFQRQNQISGAANKSIRNQPCEKWGQESKAYDADDLEGLGELITLIHTQLLPYTVYHLFKPAKLKVTYVLDCFGEGKTPCDSYFHLFGQFGSIWNMIQARFPERMTKV